jgi:predicted RNase H-like HicB family nuclease
MSFESSINIEPNEFEILIRKRGEDDFTAYCPQLNIMFKGNDHERVRQDLAAHIQRHIEALESIDSIGSDDYDNNKYHDDATQGISEIIPSDFDSTLNNSADSIDNTLPNED